MTCTLAGSQLKQNKHHDRPPVWFAVLSAAECRAFGNGDSREVRFDWVAGRALYTNTGTNPEWIPALGVQVQSGHTLAVYWTPNDTAYSTEVFLQAASFAA
jgi:hypothetical protein